MGISALRMNKKGLEFKSGIFAIVALGMFVLAAGTIISQQADEYNTAAVSEIDQYNKLNTVSDQATGYRTGLTPQDPESGQDPEANTFRGVYGILTGIFSTFDIVIGEDGLLASVTTQFGLPSYVRQGIITFVLVGIAFSLIAVIFRLARRSA